MDRLAAVLAREHRLLAELRARLAAARNVATSGETRLTLWAATEVQKVVRRLREVELHRAVLATDVADGLRIDPEELTLGVLARVAPGPWRDLFACHRLAFLGFMREIDGLLDAPRRPPVPSLVRFLR
ncbi:MAG: hypothetical protein HYU28_11330 [Actinobacteria bacterium]|nr:hypothetical protein [Actinomycetota bacterium]